MPHDPSKRIMLRLFDAEDVVEPQPMRQKLDEKSVRARFASGIS